MSYIVKHPAWICRDCSVTLSPAQVERLLKRYDALNRTLPGWEVRCEKCEAAAERASRHRSRI